MIAERSHYLFSHTRVLWLEADIRHLWFGQEKCAVGFALDTSKRYVERANRYPLLVGGCDVTTHSRNPQRTQETPC